MNWKTRARIDLVIIVAAFTLIMVGIVGISYAADQMIDAKITKLTFQLDKNGNPYARAIVDMPAELNGVKYTKSVAVMAFGEGNQLEDLQEGGQLKAIVEGKEYKGRTSYTLIKLIE